MMIPNTMAFLILIALVNSFYISFSSTRKFIYIFFPVFVLFMILIISLRDVGPDTLAYIDMYNNININDGFNLNLYPGAMTQNIEVGFYNLIFIMRSIGFSDVFFFGIVSFIFLLSFFYFAYKFLGYDEAVLAFVFLIATYTFYQLNFNQIRQGVAVSGFLISLPFLFYRQYIKYLLAIVVSSFFHVSVIMTLPLTLLLFLRSNFIVCVVFIFLGFLAGFFSVGRYLMEIISFVMPSSLFLNKINFYLNRGGEFSGAGAYNVTFILSSLGLLFLSFFYFRFSKRSEKIDFILLAVVFGYFYSAFFFDVNVLYQRVLYYYDVIYPCVASAIFLRASEKNKPVVSVFLGCFLFVFSFKTIFSSTSWFMG